MHHPILNHIHMLHVAGAVIPLPTMLYQSRLPDGRMHSPLGLRHSNLSILRAFILFELVFKEWDRLLCMLKPFLPNCLAELRCLQVSSRLAVK